MVQSKSSYCFIISLINQLNGEDFQQADELCAIIWAVN